MIIHRQECIYHHESFPAEEDEMQQQPDTTITNNDEFDFMNVNINMAFRCIVNYALSCCVLTFLLRVALFVETEDLLPTSTSCLS